MIVGVFKLNIIVLCLLKSVCSPLIGFLFEKFCNKMVRLFWVFVVVAVVVPLSDARPHKCEQRERSIADLDLAEDALNKAKDLYPNCEESESSNSTECSKKDKSLGFLDVALDLVSNAKKNIPICPKEPPVNITTEGPTTSVTTEQPLTKLTTEEPLTKVTTVDPKTESTTEGSRPIDCQDVRDAGAVTSGVYEVWPRGENSTVRVRCDMETAGGGWTVIQRRGNFSKQENFDREWKDYKHGFGDLQRDHWMGNDLIFTLTNQDEYSLRIDMTAADGESAYALFRAFRIEDETPNYKLLVGGYSGTAGDSMTYSNSRMFSTRDRKNNIGASRNCAELYKGGFWYDSCALCNPNGLYKPGVKDYSSMFYWDFKNYVGLFSMEMKIKRLIIFGD